MILILATIVATVYGVGVAIGLRAMHDRSELVSVLTWPIRYKGKSR